MKEDENGIPIHEEDISFHVATLTAETAMQFSMKTNEGITENITGSFVLVAGDSFELYFTPDDKFLEALWERFGDS